MPVYEVKNTKYAYIVIKNPLQGSTDQYRQSYTNQEHHLTNFVNEGLKVSKWKKRHKAAVQMQNEDVRTHASSFWLT